MSTRSCIARPTESGFTGVYHHWDGYPSGLGLTLWQLAQPMGPFHGNIGKMLKVLIDEHPAGWSTINGADFSLKPGYDEFRQRPCVVCKKSANKHLCQTYGVDWHKKRKKPYPCGENYGMHLGHALEERPPTPREQRAEDRPNCYCHGDRKEEGWEVTQANAAGSGCEFAYVIDQETEAMLVMGSYTDIGSESGKKDVKMVGAFGMGDENSVWQPLGIVDLRAEPNAEFMSTIQNRAWAD